MALQSDTPLFDHKIDSEGRTAIIDDLARGDVVRSIVNDLRTATEPPVVGLYGNWGSGKSFLLDMVCREINAGNVSEARMLIPCLFNSWRHEMEADLSIGLIKSIRDASRPSGCSGFSRDTVITVANSLLELLLDLAPSFTFGGSAIVSVLGTVVKSIHCGVTDVADKKKAAERRTYSEEIDAKMRELVSTVTGAAEKAYGKPCQLVVLIDDLDRCSPENMVRMFEWLKVHLTVPGCSYVLALDHVAAARAIVGEYKKYLADDTDLAYGFRYLEKLVTTEYELGFSDRVELMALRAIYGRKAILECTSALARAQCGGDFPGMANMDAVLRLKCLLIPRTMLKVVHKFSVSLNSLNRPALEEVRNRMPASYPFWLLLLVAMYFRLDPSQLDAFALGGGPIYRVLEGRECDEREWGSGPLREFCEYAKSVRETTGESMGVPSPGVLLPLSRVIREGSIAVA